MKTVMFGGTFDPVHVGHLFLAEELISQLGYERVILVPAAKPPHKETSGETSAAQRLEMLRMSIQGNDRLVVDDCEVERGGQSYTVDTVPAIERTYRPTGPLGLVIGDDLLAGFDGWKEHARLVTMVEIVVAHRVSRARLEFSYPHRYIDNLLLPISSSDIRERIRDGKAFRHIVPETVFSYIERNMLYRQRDSH